MGLFHTGYISVLHGTSLQQTTFQMSHLYYNWYGRMQTPAVREYAGRLAKHIF